VKGPKLTPDVLADQSKLGGILDAVVSTDDNYRRLTQKILVAQDRLQQLVSEDAWVEFLLLEEAVTERANITSLLITRWAFLEGRRTRGGR
jgi:hypothetical protein